ncbi:Pentatricopeptide repeat-containing protein, chloroplastic [Symbiodinium microadriaticum]|uniref:Pentatricopeptide repeat-containing protein, chloroplastic n=1 Tax=Symbiodinium microadriaticum TaxID=2951 RepID=A0A1Q9EBF6_SYMMI|nr:Pentatricopeptide repeat-containing protein, chloroplastic [Symbiodinium microadriaticum]
MWVHDETRQPARQISVKKSHACSDVAVPSAGECHGAVLVSRSSQRFGSVGHGMRGPLKLARHSGRKATNSILNAFVRAGDWQEAFQILQDSGRNADVVHFTLGLRSCVSAAAWQAALSMLPWLARLQVSPDQHLFGSALTVCGRAARWREALAILSLNSQPSLVARSAAMTACEKAGKWQMVLGMLYHLPILRLQPDCACAVEKLGLWRVAIWLLEDIGRLALQADLVNMSGVLSALGKGHRWKRALALLSSMTLRLLRPSTVSYSATITACEKGRAWEHALLLFRETRRQVGRKIPVDVAMLTSLMAACDVGGRWQDALSLLATARANRSGCESGDLKQDFKAIEELQSTCLSACNRSLQWEAALAILQSDVCDFTGLNCAIQACAGASRWSLAVSMVEGCYHTATLSVVLGACVACQELPIASGVYNLLRKSRNNSEEAETSMEASHLHGARTSWSRHLSHAAEVGGKPHASLGNVSSSMTRRLLDMHQLRAVCGDR